MMDTASPPLFPAPRHVDHFDPTVVVADTEVRAAFEGNLPAQGYRLAVDADGIRLGHADEAGRRYGEAALSQLRRADGTLPVAHIRDWPDIAVRGYMLDISRDRVPTRETLQRLVEVLALARYNHLQLYVEH